MRKFCFILLYISCLFSTEFDSIVIGSSPFSLFEALYQYHSGKRVLILEEACNCGGAWKVIQICGIANVDLGCHRIGNNSRLKNFLEIYAGCTIVSLDNPKKTFEEKQGPNGWYFSRGCFELIDHLLQLISMTEISLENGQKAETVVIDNELKVVTVKTKTNSYQAKKLILTPMSNLNFPQSSAPQKLKKKSITISTC